MLEGHPVATTGARTAARDTTRRAAGLGRMRHAEWLLFVLFLGPSLLLFGIFSFWPMLQNAYLSTVRWDMISPTKTYVGAANYRYLVADDTFRTVLWNNLVFTVGTVGGSLLLGLATALLLNQPLRGRDGARAVLFAPTLLSGAAIGIVRVMTEGGPVDATNTLVYYVYEQGFVAFNAGRAAAAALILFAIMLGITLLQLRYAEERVHYA